MDHEQATYSALWAAVNAVGGLTSLLLFFDDAAIFLTRDDRTLLARVAAFIFNGSRESRTHVAWAVVSDKPHKRFWTYCSNRIE